MLLRYLSQLTMNVRL